MFENENWLSILGLFVLKFQSDLKIIFREEILGSTIEIQYTIKNLYQSIT